METASPANTTVSRPPAGTTPDGAAAAAYSTPQGATGSTSLEDTGGFDPFSVTLRLEGRTGTRFGGSCGFGDERRPVEGRVPGRFVIDTEGLELACRISTVGGRAGDQLRVVLTADGRTRSVQEVQSGGTVSVSYDPPARGG
ncbi:hypothetical protein [Rubrobacter indicoceani]|uniref:hypothetical protein n=1 Tax=Rubrobacter indicoceani TaxID=2051957 RepID=UPI000E5AF624|nr:hypothetical protein [Rubrobacter indicoceani]